MQKPGNSAHGKMPQLQKQLLSSATHFQALLPRSSPVSPALAEKYQMEHAEQRNQVSAVHLISRWDLPACFLETLSGSEGLKGAGKHPYQGLGMRHKVVLVAVAVSPPSDTVL